MTTPASTLPWRQLIAPDRLHPGPDNPRTDPGDFSGLTESIKKQGLKQPLLVEPAHEKGDGHYWIVDGWRRYLSMREWSTGIPAVIVPPRPGEKRPVRAILTGLVTDSHRKDLNQIERAKAFKRLQDEFGFTATEIAGQIGMSVSTVTTSLMLLDLAPATQKMVANKEISAADVTKLLRSYRAKQRKKNGQPVRGAMWEPPWFASTHQLAAKAQVMCDAMDHSMRRRYGAKGSYPGACGQCWQRCIESNYEQVLKAQGWTPPDGQRPTGGGS